MEFVAVVPLLFLVGLTVLQVALLAHARAVIGAAADEAARAAAVSADPGAAAAARARDIIGSALGGLPMSDLRLARGEVSGLPVVSVEVVAQPHLFLLPDFVTVTGSGRALLERAP